LRAGDEDQAVGVLVRHPELIQFRMPGNRRTVLHLVSALLFPKIAAWLLDHGADVDAETDGGSTPLDVAGMLRDQSDRERGHADMVKLLLDRGAKISARAAVVLGDEKLLRELHASGDIVAPRDADGWLLRVAVDHDRPDILKLLLDFGLDPDARVRAGESDDIEFSWGMPLYECVRAHRHDLAEMLLEHGADPNGAVYASGTPLSEAYGQRDEQMIALLERYGGKSNPSMAGFYRRKDLALRLLAEQQ
jgi:ankyrin repeat protein